MNVTMTNEELEKHVAHELALHADRIEKAVMKEVGGYAYTHPHFPLDALLRAIRNA